MSDGTKIEWTDTTWNPVTGCTKVSEGCEHCYIERTPPFRMEGRRFHLPVIGGSTGVRLHEDRLGQPLHWRKPRKVFVNSLADLFHEDVPDTYIARIFAVMAAAPTHTFQVLTKRHARMRSLLRSDEFVADVRRQRWHFPHTVVTTGPEWPLPNVWLGVSVESQKWADLRIPALLDTPAAVRWLSCEPLLGPVDLRAWLSDDPVHFFHRQEDIDWVVVGGESGPGARPMHPEWARSLRDQCDAESVPFLFKQWGEWGPAPWVVRVCDPAIGWHGTEAELAAAKANAESRGATHVYASWAHEYGHDLYEPPHKPWSAERTLLTDPHHAPMRKWGKKAAGRELDGRTHDEYPAISVGADT